MFARFVRSPRSLHWVAWTAFCFINFSRSENNKFERMDGSRGFEAWHYEIFVFFASFHLSSLSSSMSVSTLITFSWVSKAQAATKLKDTYESKTKANRTWVWGKFFCVSRGCSRTALGSWVFLANIATESREQKALIDLKPSPYSSHSN